MKKILVILAVLVSVNVIGYADNYFDDLMGTINMSVKTTFLNEEKKTGFTPIRIALFQDIAIPWYVKTVGGLDLGILSTRANNVYGVQASPLVATSNKVIGIQFGLGFAITEEQANAIQIGGVTYSLGEYNGLQFSVVLSGVEKGFKGLQVSVMNAFVDEESYGIQLSGLSTYSGDKINGLQLSALTSYSDGLNGIQITGIYAAGAVKGIGISAFRNMGMDNHKNLDGFGINISAFNYAVKAENKCNFTGLIFSGINVGNADIKGLQAGIFNSASLIKGVQLGVINYASSLSGLQIGAVNIAKNASIPVLPVANFSF